MGTRTGFMATDRPERYAKQLASHWSEKTDERTDGDFIVLAFPNGNEVSMTPAEGGLSVTVTVPDGDATDFADVVARHLERFGQKQELAVAWQEATH